MELNGKKIAILGLGAVGLHWVKVLAAKGAQVVGFGFLSEGKVAEKRPEFKGIPVRFVLKEIPEDGLKGFDLVLMTSDYSPSLRAAAEWARENGIAVKNDLDFLQDYMKGKVIGVTGTCGKTSTVDLLEKMLLAQGYKVLTLGGRRFEWGQLILKPAKYDYYLLEIGSHRLKATRTFHPHIAVLLNVFPAHGERHGGSLLNYAETKAKIFANLTEQDFLVHEASAPNIQELIRRQGSQAQKVRFALESEVRPPGAYHHQGKIYWQDSKGTQEEYSLKGRVRKFPTRVLNALAAITVAKLCGVKQQTIQQVLDEYKSLEGRLKTVREVDDITFFDDSYSSNIGATSWALYSFARPVIWIAGGRPEYGSGLNNLKTYLKGRVKLGILFGTHREKVAKLLGEIVPFHKVETLKQAVELAKELAEEGDVVLFSPACPPDEQSGELGDSRREDFIEIVKKLPSTPKRVGDRTKRATFKRI